MTSRISVLTLGLLLFTSSSLRAQETPLSNKWMLEVSYNNKVVAYIEVPDDGSDARGGLTLSVDKEKGLVQSLQLSHRLVDDNLLLEVSLLSVSMQGKSAFPPTHVFIGNYVLRPNEPITLSQLTDYGFKTAEMKLVSARPTGFISPTVINRTSSLKVEGVDANRANYKVSLRNLSSMPVWGLVFLVSDAEGTCVAHRIRATAGFLIDSGEVGATELEVPDEQTEGHGRGGESCSITNSTPSESSHPIPQIVVDGVVFADGSHEGDDSKVYMLDAEKAGGDSERKRIGVLLDAIFESAGTRDGTKVATLESQVGALSEEPEPEVIQSVLARYSMLPDDATKSIRSNAQNGIRFAKDEFLYQLKLFGDLVSNGQITNVSLRDWWNATRGQCDYLVPICRELVSSQFRLAD